MAFVLLLKLHCHIQFYNIVGLRRIFICSFGDPFDIFEISSLDFTFSIVEKVKGKD